MSEGRTFRFGSICSGIEAASVAWEPLGWRPEFFAEIDPFASAVLAHHYPEVPNRGDFTQIETGEGTNIDLLVGGTPCQGFSVAGLRKGLGDDRSNLALEFLRLAGRLRPRWLAWENVPGCLSSNGGRDFGTFLGGLVELGYGFAYRILDAQYVRIHGFGRAVPQRRRRVFVVGYLGDWRRAAAVLFERESLSGNPPPRRDAGASVAALTACGVGTCGADDNQAQAGHLIAQPAAPPLTSNYFGDHESREGLLVAHTLRGDGFDASEDGTGRGTPLVPCVAQTLQASDGGPSNGYVPVIPTQSAIAFQERGREAGRTLEWQDDLAYSLNAPSGGGRRHELNIAWRWAVRRLTPIEAERLQGFSDDYTLVPYRGKPAADGPRYRAIGNSMATNVMRWLGHRVNLVESLIGGPTS